MCKKATIVGTDENTNKIVIGEDETFFNMGSECEVQWFSSTVRQLASDGFELQYTKENQGSQ